MAHLITGNKFDPNKDIPDLSGKVSEQPKNYLQCMNPKEG